MCVCVCVWGSKQMLQYVDGYPAFPTFFFKSSFIMSSWDNSWVPSKQRMLICELTVLCPATLHASPIHSLQCSTRDVSKHPQRSQLSWCVYFLSYLSLSLVRLGFFFWIMRCSQKAHSEKTPHLNFFRKVECGDGWVNLVFHRFHFRTLRIPEILVCPL